VRLADETLAQIVAWANHRDDVQAAILLGSQARTEHKADEWSDIDVVLVVDDPDHYLGSSAWLAGLGSPLLTFVQPAALGGGLERRVLFRSGMDVDFAFVPAAVAQSLATMADDPEVLKVLGRGVRVLVDTSDYIKEALDGRSYSGPLVDLPSQAEFEQTVISFWYHVILAAKKLRRGEVWVAKSECDSHLKKRVVELMTWQARLTNPQADTWHEGRFLEEWADRQSLEEFRDACARYDPSDVARALRATAEMFERLEVACAQGLGFPVAVSHVELRKELDSVLERSVGGG
jgi:aminoglycoside 6-adenylyltransferase